MTHYPTDEYNENMDAVSAYPLRMTTKENTITKAYAGDTGVVNGQSTAITTLTLPYKSTNLFVSNMDGANSLNVSFDNGDTWITLLHNTSIDAPTQCSAVLLKSTLANVAYQVVAILSRQ